MADGPIAYPMEQDRPELSKLALLLSGYKAKAPDGVDPNAPAAVNPAPEPKSLYAVPGRMGGFSTNAPAEVAPPPVSSVAPGAPGAAVPPPLEDPLVQQVRSYRNASSARSNAIQSDMQRDAQPIDRNNPSVKPHWTDRLLGGLVGFGLGYGGNRNAAEIGGDVTNRKFNEAERQRGGRLAADTLASKEFDRGNQQYDRNIENEIRAQQLERQNSVEQREGKESDARIRNIDSQIEERNNKPEKLSPAKQRQSDLNDFKSAGIALTPDEEKQYTLTGKLPEVKEPNTEPELALAHQRALASGDMKKAGLYKGALDELARQKAADRGPKDTSAADVAKAIQVGEFRRNKLNDVDRQIETERQRKYKDLEGDIGLKYNRDAMSKARQKVDEEIEGKRQQRSDDVSAEADKMLGLTKSGDKLKRGSTPAAAPAATPTPAPQASAAQAGERAVKVNGQVVGYTKDGKTMRPVKQ